VALAVDVVRVVDAGHAVAQAVLDGAVADIGAVAVIDASAAQVLGRDDVMVEARQANAAGVRPAIGRELERDRIGVGQQAVLAQADREPDGGIVSPGGDQLVQLRGAPGPGAADLAHHGGEALGADAGAAAKAGVCVVHHRFLSQIVSARSPGSRLPADHDAEERREQQQAE
jgi:hypothetical protein